MPEWDARSCPVDHGSLAQQKTARITEPGGPAVACDQLGVWHIRGYREAKTILCGDATKQAGFKAELLDQMPHTMNRPVLYQEGPEHHQQRRQTARFFTPKATSTNYRRVMETLSDQLIARLKRAGRADLSKLSMALAVRVAGEVVGLTNSRLPGMDRRLNAFFADDIVQPGWNPRALYTMFRNQYRVALFYGLDVGPAIQKRRRAPGEHT